MSRHTLPSKHPGLTVTVGWDGPLQTFFAQVLRDVNYDDDEDEDDPAVLWIGCAVGEIALPDSLVEPLRPYADLDAATLALLRQDIAESNAPTPLQRFTRGLGQ